MKNFNDILIKPIITEKSTNLKEQDCYSFVVDKNTNKIEVKQAVEKIFKVDVISVNIICVKSKRKKPSHRRREGFTASYKKAIVKLKKGSKIASLEV